MTGLDPLASNGSSVLQRRFSLGELVDASSFREVCSSYAELFRISFKVFDSDGQLLVDAKGNRGDLCAYVRQLPKGRSSCTKEVTTIREKAMAADKLSYFDCFTGLRYIIAPIKHEGDALGSVVYGPYRPQGVKMPDLAKLDAKVNPETIKRLQARTPAAAEEVAKRVVDHLVQVIEVILYTGYKQILTSRLHFEAVTSSYEELQRKNKQLRDSFERLKELDKLKSSFLATVSHELRTPLTSVIGYSEMLMEGLAGKLNEEQMEYVKTIMEKGENLLSLIASILDFSKVESGNLRLARKLTDVKSVVNEAMSTVIPIAQKGQINLISEVSSDLPQINMDGEKIRQAIINILGNAVKFNKPGGQVKLKANTIKVPKKIQKDDLIPAAFAPPDESFLQICITDTGIGIPEDKLSKVFDSFYQVDGSSTREYGGTGLGLAISNSYITAHGGHIELESERGKGSSFTIYIPMETVP